MRCVSVTCVIAAAASSGAHLPHPFELVVVPVVQIIACERIWSQVTDVQSGELLDEVRVRHPEQRNTFLNKERPKDMS